MKPLVIFCIVLLLLLIPSATAANQPAPAKEIVFINEQFPPFSFQEDGKLQGISVDLLEKMLGHMNTTLNRGEIKLLPWDQGYQMALHDNNTVIFTTGRIPDREALFKWVGPISSIKVVLFALNEKHIKINSPGDLRALKIGVTRDSAEGPVAIKAGANPGNLVEKNNTTEILDILKAGTIDAWAYPDIVGFWLANKAGLNASEYEIVYELEKETPLYCAFNKNTSDSTVKAFQEALNQTKKGKEASGVSDFEMVLYRYLPVLYGRSNMTSHQIMDLLNKTSADIERNASGTFINISAGARSYKDNPDIALFVIDTKAIVMAHSSRPELVGSNETNRADVSGKKFIEAMVAGALKNGAGQEDYIYSDPNRTGLYYKSAYYRLSKVSDVPEYIVGCIDYKEEGSKN
ncbi:Bacterial extracellular solute-binding proteins, family 3 [uncultured archaeon]|nr:Bacterial extracellular solute-binding proteins, family 3 [uncultured archaeon]